MHNLTSNEIVVMFVALGMLLAAARAFAEVARRFNQPMVLGELLAGIVLGPTVLGAAFPELVERLFPQQGNLAVALDGLTTVAISLFLLVAGMEVDLSSIWRQGRAAVAVSVSGIVLPFSVGLAIAIFAPHWIGGHAEVEHWPFALFFAAAMSISALPVIAKTLMDLDIYRSDLGMIVIAAAVFNDLIGWLIFALILGMVGAGGLHSTWPIGWTIALTVGFAGGVLTAGRWFVHRSLPWIQAHTGWPGGVLGFALSLGLLGAAFTHWIGVHSVFGAFLVGVAIGDSSHLREQTRTIIHQFVSFIFAPLFFASIGLKINFAAHFDVWLTIIVMTIACAGKIVGCGFAARWGGIAPREAWAIGFAMNARGAMEIIFGLLGLQMGLIRERLFVTLVVVAMGTSMMSGPIMQKLLRLKRPRRLSDFIAAKGFIPDLQAATRSGVIRELSTAAAAVAGLDADVVTAAVLAREEQAATGLEDRLAVPHARLASLTRPVVALGLSDGGVDFDAPDGAPSQIIFLILTPQDDDGAQLELLADVARTFRHEHVRQRALEVRSFTEFLALARTQPITETPT